VWGYKKRGNNMNQDAVEESSQVMSCVGFASLPASANSRRKGEGA
jgi:hypothetical protein